MNKYTVLFYNEKLKELYFLSDSGELLFSTKDQENFTSLFNLNKVKLFEKAEEAIIFKKQLLTIYKEDNLIVVHAVAIYNTKKFIGYRTIPVKFKNGNIIP